MSSESSKSGESSMDDIIAKCKKIRDNAEKAIRASNKLPCSDFVLYQSYSGFSKVMSHESKTIMELLQAMCKGEKVQPKSLTKASTEEKFDMIVEINDSILDRVGNILDEAEGLKKKTEDLVITTLNMPTIRREIKSDNRFTKWTEKMSKDNLTKADLKSMIRKPQLSFEDKVDNFNIFRPIIKFKHNSIKPLSIVKEYDIRGDEYFANPYEIEINSYKLLGKYLKKVKHLHKPKPIDQTKFKFIDTQQCLNELLEHLRIVEEFAVDLEYHNQRSFLGFTCLIQISTREQDFIIDAIELRSHLHIMNEVFTDPKILKIFHGADLDIKWLQKDFGIYVVNMFDTGKASKLLQFASFSLSFLVKHYCNEVLNKKYQLADWRIRPLPNDMIDYARSDTHSLLYIFDRMRNDLIEKEGIQLLQQAFEESRKVCLGRFEVPIIQENSYMALIMKNRVEFNNRQRQALKDIYAWRDKLARTEDECTNYVLPNHMMLKIAEVLPQEQQGILACCNPIPVMVKKHLNELHLIVLKARELPLKKSTDYVYSLKPIVNQIVDITSNMDILDDHADEHVVAYDCLLDTPAMLHKIKLSRNKTKNDSTDCKMLGNFFAFKSIETASQPSSKLRTENRELTPYEKYCRTIENKKKVLIEKTRDKEEVKIDINQVPEIVSKEITNEPIVEMTEEEEFAKKEELLTKRLETTPIIEINKKKKIKPDIPCEVDKSIDNLISTAMSSKTEGNGDDDGEGNVEDDDVEIIDGRKTDASDSGKQQFNYDKADYQIFSQNSQQSNNFFDPSAKFMKQKQRNKAFNSRTKRKRDFYISSNQAQGQSSNKKSK